jgi:hypothetical protein
MSASPVIVFKPYMEYISGNKSAYFAVIYYLLIRYFAVLGLCGYKKYNIRSEISGNLQTSGQREILCTIFIQFRLRLKLDLLRAGLFGVRSPVGEGVEIIHNVKTGPGSHPALYTIGIETLSSVKRADVALNTQPCPNAEDKGRV